MIFYCHFEHSPGINLALEEVLTVRTTEDIFMLWQNSPTVIVGRNQNVEAEVDVAFARKCTIPIFRRISGGGAVYHDAGTINFSYVTSRFQSTREELHAPILRIFQEILPEKPILNGNDISISDRKICGTAQRFFGQRQLFHGCILYDTELAVLEQILTPPVSKLRRHGVASIRARVGNIVEFLPSALSIQKFLALLIQQTALYFGIQQPLLVPEIFWRHARRLAAEKYCAWEKTCPTMSL